MMKSGMKRCIPGFLFVLFFVITGCAKVPEQKDIMGFYKLPEGKREDFKARARLYESNRKILSDKYGHEWRFNRDRTRRDEPPQLGIAISGGGARSASFSIGVLKALEENGILEKVDVISAVSGGAYATYWYYSQNCYFNKRDVGGVACKIRKKGVEQDKYQLLVKDFKPADIFRAGTLLEPVSDGELAKLVALGNKSAGRNAEWPNNITSLNRYRFQHALEESSNILTYSKEDGLEGKTLNVLQQTANVGVLTFSVPVHWFVNGLFDWEVNTKPYQAFYRNGLERTYGYAPFSYSLKEFANDERFILRRAKAVPVSFSDIESYLRSKRDAEGTMPYFIINTTGGHARLFRKFGLPGNKRTVRSALFEFTPWRYGSDLFGYWPVEQSGISVSQAVAISGAAVDGQYERIDDDGNPAGGNWAMSMALDVLNLDLGCYIPNPNTPKSVRLLHKFAIFPLYFAADWLQGDYSSSIYLSDGGHTENLGAFSLIRRGVRKIIIIDGEQDGDSLFTSAKRLKSALLTELGLQMEWDQFRPISVYNTPLREAVIRGRIRGLVDERGESAPIEIFYVKLSLDRSMLQMRGQPNSGKYPFSVTSYQEKDSAFPHNTTADVFYSAEQFQAYRDLGYIIGRRLKKEEIVHEIVRSAAAVQ